MPESVAVPEGWAYEPELRPARSLLVGLEPIGLGTALAESLAGYVVRLAWRHGLAPARLARDVLSPALGGGGLPDADAAAWERELARVTRHPAGSLLGHAPVAATWADALAALTGRTDVRALTLLSWADVLPARDLLRAERAWCPSCLEMWRLRGLPVYEPLLWQVAEIRACVVHEIALSTACPACGTGSGILTAWARVGFCRCGAWLGSLVNGQRERLAAEDLDWQRYVTEQVGSLISMTPSLSGPVSALDTTKAVRLAWDRTGLSLTRLAATMGMALSTLSLWKDGRRQPSLPGALRLCRIAGVSLVDFLRADLEAMKVAPGPSPEVPYIRPSDERHAVHDWAWIHARLRRAAASEPPRSLASVLREVGLDTRQAKRACPDDCARIAERYRDWRRSKAASRMAEEASLVRLAIAELRAEGVYPSRHQVQERVPEGVSLRRPALYAVWVADGREPGRTFLKV
jgi:transcriptional regulator with XRE-family HTH domain